MVSSAPSAQAIGPLIEPVHLAIWHGWNLPLALSAVAIGGGAVIVVGSGRSVRVRTSGRWSMPSTADGYRASLRGAERASPTA